MKYPIYYINLKERTDRNLEIQKEFGDLGFPLIRIGALEKFEIEKKHFVPESVSSCWLSHQKAFKEFLNTNYTHAIIFEDDAKLTREGRIFLSNLENINLNCLDLFQFGYLRHQGFIDFPTFDPFPFSATDLRKVFGVSIAKIDVIHRNWIRTTRFIIRILLPPTLTFLRVIRRGRLRQRSSQEFYKIEIKIRKKYKLRVPIIYHSIEAGSHAYIVSRSLAEKLLNFNNPVFLPADLALMSIGRSKNFVVARTSKSLCNQNNSESSIKERSINTAWRLSE